MTTVKQKRFVRSLSKEIADTICRSIDQGAIPQDWDGHELRALLASRHGESAAMSVIKQEPRSRRAREFRNTVIVRNL
jgi:hypothetical protein